MKNFKLINIYISKIFLVKFLQITSGISLLIFITNLIDTMEKVAGKEVSFFITALISFLQIPDFLNDISSSLVLISAIISFFILSSRSELTIIRTGGFSLWQIVKPVAFSSFFLGIFWIMIFNPLSIKMMRLSYALEREYINNDTREYIEPRNGIWLKQNNVDKPNEEIIIQAKKVYKETAEFDSVKIWFFNENDEFYKKIDAKKMFLENDYWQLQDTILNDNFNLNKKLSNLSIKTTLDNEFIIKKVVNNSQNPKLFNIFETPSLINNLKGSGFSPTKFQVHFNSLLSKPILFLAMALISCFFGLNHIRNNNSIIMIFLGIALGLIIFIISGIVNTLGSSGLISIFASTWIIALIFLAIGTLLIYRKEHI